MEKYLDFEDFLLEENIEELIVDFGLFEEDSLYYQRLQNA
jgi:hypothetical protein